MLKNNLQGLLVVFLLKQININIMDTHHLDFLSPANETPREKNFDDVYLQLDREDALIVEEHLNNIPRVNFNFKKCHQFMHKHLINAIVEGNYTIISKSDCVIVVLVNEIAFDLWVGNGADSFCFYDNYFNSDIKTLLKSFDFSKVQKNKAYKLAKEKTSKSIENQKSEIQKQIDLLNAKMKAL